MSSIKKLNKATAVVKLLQEDGVIICSSDTLPGLSCRAFSEKARARIETIKGERSGKTFLLLVADLTMLEHYVGKLNQEQLELVNAERATTVIYLKNKNIPEFALAPDQSIALRICKNTATAQMIKLLGEPIVSTSANVSGNPPASDFDAISPELIDKIDGLWNNETGPLGNKKASRLVKIANDGTCLILRE